MYKVLAVSGYKPHELGIFNEKHDHLPYLKYAIKKKLQQLIESYDIQWIITSGQPGVELWAAEATIQLKNEYNHLKLSTLAPFYEQEERWSDPVKELYRSIWEKSDYKDYITKRKYDNPMQLRQKNQFIIEKSDAFLVLFDEYTEGSPTYYLTYAKKKGDAMDYPIIYLTPDEIEEVIRESINNNNWN
ncbi:SLOG family protein [Evansella sp. AB-P1]|uniref:SLOG family protein n=1 Tax=Evansella sp. AB-P1 TaxID=3037653 RepID=UPI00241BEF92|nr:SLOG family protein [Evansella sp. AB-P1]MDG5788481.1 SLOG family protein [Evansella sp. AB-P1]